jgi:2-polyprenyl-3-methyl-5-hydroxy-6-metoxy-1,4-benzoquinol methylase
MAADLLSDPPGFETLEVFSRVNSFILWQYEKIRGFVHGDVLEIGSGIGNISAFILSDNHSVTLSDIRPEYGQILRQKFQNNPNLKTVLNLDIADPDFQIRHKDILFQFDTVIALNVIEHIADDNLAIRNAASLLKKNGSLVILVPAGQRLYNRLDKELGHYRRYSKKSLTSLMSSEGLSLDYSGFFNAPAILGWWVSGKLLKEKMITESKLKLFNQFVPVFKFMDWFASPFFGISVISVAIKNKSNP